MKNHFYISYPGNKRNEVINIVNNISFNNIKTIIEPFCGTCAMSYYIWVTNKDKNYKYILNDNNPYLQEMFNIIKDKTKTLKFEEDFTKIVNSFYKDGKYNKEKYKEIVKQKNLLGWFISQKIYGTRNGMCPLDSSKKTNIIKLDSFPIYNFFNEADIIFTNTDWYTCFNKYENEDNCLFLFDPPYIDVTNDFYCNPKMDIYQYFHRNNNTYTNHKNKICFILEKMWIIDLLFKNWNEFIYPKKYTGYIKRNSEHVIYQNHLICSNH